MFVYTPCCDIDIYVHDMEDSVSTSYSTLLTIPPDISPGHLSPKKTKIMRKLYLVNFDSKTSIH